MAVTAKARQRLILLATIAASGISFLAGTAVNIALPTIQRAFAVSVTELQWVVNAQLLMLSALLLLSGSLGDRYGRKKVFVTGIGLFTMAALISAFAQSITQLIILQALQGIGAAMMIPGSLAIINYCFPESERGRAIGLWSGLSAGLAALGPFVSGFVVDQFGWPGIYIMLVPFGIAAFIIALKVVPENKNESAGKLDWWGASLIFFSLSGIAFALIQGSAWGWTDPYILSSIIGGVVLFVAFVFLEHRVREPLVPPILLRHRLVLSANVVTLLLYFALNGLTFFLTLYLQQVQGYSPTIAGLAFLPAIAFIAAFSGLGGKLADRIGPRLPLIVGSLVVAAGHGWLLWANPGDSFYTAFLPGLALFGIGMAMVIAPLTKSALAVDQRYSGAASGLNNVAARIAGLVAIALLGSLAASIFSADFTDRVQASALASSEAHTLVEQSDKLAGIEIPDTFDHSTRMRAREIINTSFTKSFRTVLVITTSLAVISSLISFFLIRKKEKENNS